MNQELVDNAISFLSNPNVASSSKEKKIDFLKSKGLSEEEIDEAFKRCVVNNNSNWSNWILGFVIAGTLSYSVYSYAKKYFNELIISREEQEQEKLRELRENVKEMQVDAGLSTKNLEHQIKLMQIQIQNLQNQLKQTDISESAKKIISNHPEIPPWQLDENK